METKVLREGARLSTENPSLVPYQTRMKQIRGSFFFTLDLFIFKHFIFQEKQVNC